MNNLHFDELDDKTIKLMHEAGITPVKGAYSFNAAINRLVAVVRADALEEAVHNIAGDNTEEKCIEALAAARELTAFREVLIGDNYILRFYPSDTGWMCGISNEMMDAIEGVTK